MTEPESTRTVQYLTFTLDQEVFAVEIGKVREILDWTPTTKIPQSPEFMRGVINLRGGVVPVIDLRTKFNMTATRKTVNTCIIIVEVAHEEEMVVLGVLTDSVQEVIDLAPSHIEPAPRIGVKLNAGFISGMGKKDDHFIILLDIDKVFSPEEIALAQEVETEMTAEV